MALRGRRMATATQYELHHRLQPAGPTFDGRRHHGAGEPFQRRRHRSSTQPRAGNEHANGDSNRNPASSCTNGIAHRAFGPGRNRSSITAARGVFDRALAFPGRRNGATRKPRRHQCFASRAMIRNSLAWCAWTVAALLIAFVDRNPFLQALLLLVIVNTLLPYRRNRMPTLRIGLALAIIPIVFSVALSRFGHHVILVLPPLPIIGGPWTWEAVVFGASSGVALLLTVAVFAVLQATVRSADLLPLLPRPLYRAGTAFALSLAFAPRTLTSFQSIREARRLRGERTSWHSAAALLVPLLLTTLEQALQYGESLDARGYGSRQRSRYRPLRWSPLDLLVVAASLASIISTLVLPATTYNAYTDLVPPSPSPLSIVSILLLALPAGLAAFSRVSHAPHHA